MTKRYDPRKAGAKCDFCPLKGQTVVPPTRVKRPRFAIVGEAPGRMEEWKRESFIGPSGRLLDTLLDGAGLDRDDAHVSNSMLCRPDEDAEDVKLAATACCAPRLSRELQALGDIPIVPLGAWAVKSILGIKSIMMARGFVWKAPLVEDKKIKAALSALRRGKTNKLEKKTIIKRRNAYLILRARKRLEGRRVLPSLHPAFILRGADGWLPIVRIDFDRVSRWLAGTVVLQDDEAYRTYVVAKGYKKARRELLKMGPMIAVDVETDSPYPLSAGMLLVQISDGKRTLLAYPDNGKWGPKLCKVIDEALRARRVVMHNGPQFDFMVLERYGIGVNRWEDTLLAAHAFAGHLPKRLDHVVSTFVDSGPWKMLAGKRGGAEEKGLAPWEKGGEALLRYGAADARLTAHAWKAMRGDVAQERKVYESDKRVALMCKRMRVNGIQVDLTRRDELSTKLAVAERKMLRRIRRLVKDDEFNPARLDDLRWYLFGYFKAPPLRPTASGYPSTSSETLENLRVLDTDGGTLADLVLQWRSYAKARSTFVDGPDLDAKGRQHPGWKLGPITGRLAASPFSIMNLTRRVLSEDIKKRLKGGEKMDALVQELGGDAYELETRIREMYIARPGYKLVYFDLSQAEARAAAHISGDARLIEACKKDIHAANAIVVFPDKREILLKDPKGAGKEFRDVAKNCGFAVWYRGTAERVFITLTALGFHVSIDECEALVDKFQDEYTRYYEYCDENVAFCRKHGYLRTALLGRKRFFGFHPKETELSNCLDAETEALTLRGWVKGFDLRPGDKLLTKNAETGKMTWEPIARLQLFPKYTGELFEFKSQSFNAVTTPDHRWLVHTRHTGVDECRRTHELAGGSGAHSIHRTGDYVAPPKPTYTNDFVELIGWILTDGRVSIKGNHQQINVYQSLRANAAKAKQISRLFRRLGVTPTFKRVAHGGGVWRLNGGTPLTRIVCGLIPDRTLPWEFLFSLTRGQLDLLRETMLLGDGNVEQGGSRTRFTCRDAPRADVFQALCVLSGIATTARWRGPSRPKKQYRTISNRPKSRGIWIITLLRRTTAQVLVHKKCYGENRKRVNQVRRFRPKAPIGVWCPVVRNTYFVARRRGDVFITGNTPVQSFIADLMNERLPQIEERLPSREALLVAQVHDAAIFEVRERFVPEMEQRIREAWAKPILVPANGLEFVMPVDIKTADRWSDLG